MKLRDYQVQVIDQCREAIRAGHARMMMYLPTGAGKTVIAGQIIKSAVARGRQVLFVVHMIQLVEQARAHFEAVGLRVGILQGQNTDFSDQDEVIVASIQTINARNAPEWCSLVIIDEAHLLFKAHIRLMQNWAEVPFIGLSATPLRPDLGKHFSALVKGPTVQALTDAGHLVPAQAFCPEPERIAAILDRLKLVNSTHGGKDWREDDLVREFNVPTIVGDVITNWQRYGEDRQTLVFAINKAHSRAIVEAFQVEGIAAAHIEDRTPPEERRELIAAFTHRGIRVLSSVGVLSVGFDSPIASCGILARPTASTSLHIQQVGRLIRPCDGKTDAILLDHAGNVLRHGLPTDFEVTDLKNGKHDFSTSKKAGPRLTTCSNCWFIFGSGQTSCPKCGTDRPKAQANVNVADGELVAYGSGKKSSEVYTAAERREWWLGFKWHATAMGYKPGWAWHKQREKFGVGPSNVWQHEAPIPPCEAQLRWLKSQKIRQIKSSLKASDKCRFCGCVNLQRSPGKGPHSAGITCVSCGRLHRWMSHREVGQQAPHDLAVINW